MKIYTSYYSMIKHLPKNIIPISIARKPPIGYKGLEYKILAPNKKMLYKWKFKVKGEEDKYKNNDYYTEEYNKQINSLSFFNVFNDLLNLGQGKDLALICYEKPNCFCHRHLIANWFNNYNITIKEYNYDTKEK